MNPTVEENLIYDTKEKVIYVYDNKIYIVRNGKEIKQLEFKEFIREIDIIPEQTPAWKRETILKMVKRIGYTNL